MSISGEYIHGSKVLLIIILCDSVAHNEGLSYRVHCVYRLEYLPQRHTQQVCLLLWINTLRDLTTVRRERVGYEIIPWEEAEIIEK